MSANQNIELSYQKRSPSSDEDTKRRREIALVGVLSVLFVILTWIEIRLFGVSQKLPFVHSIFFFGLVNFNIVILLGLVFFIFRNIVKVFVERRSRVIGSSLKAKLIAAFVAFISIPTILMFLISVFYINSSFDKWFSVKMAGVLKSSLEVTNEYYISAKKRNYHFATQIAKELGRQKNRQGIQRVLDSAVKNFRLDAVEYYPGVFAEPEISVGPTQVLPEIPRASLEFLQKGVMQRSEDSVIHQFGAGNLVRVIVPMPKSRAKGAVVVSSFVPLSLITQIDDISSAYEDFRNLNPLEYPLKSIYLVILILMTLVILLCGTWFGFHLAKQLSVPLETLGRATQRVAQGDYQPVEMVTGSTEMNLLIENFNQMTNTMAQSQQELKKTLDRLDERTRYMQVVLSQASTGVISVDNEDKITTINRYACQLLKVDASQVLGTMIDAVLGADWNKTYKELIRGMKKYKRHNVQKEIRISIHGQAIPIQMSLSILQDENKQEIGRVIVFDDLTMVVSAQRAAAWTEVARRIAHEIKNPLTPIKLSAQRLQKKFGEQIADPAFLDCTRMIIQQADDMKDLVNEFSQFARLPQAQPTLGSLNQIIEESLVLYRASHPNIQFQLERVDNPPQFNFDSEQLRRVFSNLLENSVAALEGVSSPVVAIKTHYDNVLKIVRVTVADNGQGVDAAHRDRIFEPYYSTKAEGTGLGLPIVKRIIEDHNGFIRAFANQPRGLKIILELPVVVESSQQEKLDGFA